MAWCWHHWSKWTDIEKTPERFVQERRCEKCNKIKRVVATSDLFMWFDDDESSQP